MLNELKTDFKMRRINVEREVCWKSFNRLWWYESIPLFAFDITRKAASLVADMRLNPELERHCLADAKSYCQRELLQRKSSEAMEGEVLLCLRKQFAKKVVALSFSQLLTSTSTWLLLSTLKDDS